VRPVDVLSLRLANQRLTGRSSADPTAVVAHLGAVQAQDYGAATWALGQRLLGATEDSLERAFVAGAILRTHVLRPTWHFVAPADIRWLLALTGPRVKLATSSADRQLGVDDDLVARSKGAIARALAGGTHLTRAELAAALARAGVALADGRTLAHLLMRAEVDGLICSGPRRGKQFTYALLDERVPPAGALDRDAALAELARRYVVSHGPATLRDFVWWSGLTVSDARRGLEGARPGLDQETVGALSYWLAPAAPPPMPERVYLLPSFDEYTVAYRDRDLYYDPALGRTFDRRDEVPFGNVILIGGRVAGFWRRTLGRGAVAVEARWFTPPSGRERASLEAAMAAYGAHLGRPVDPAPQSPRQPSVRRDAPAVD
jgi:hypothetical protein